MTTTLRPARLDELADLSALCLRSKAYWGYDAAFMAACTEELTLTQDDLKTDPIIVLQDGQGVAGMAQVTQDEEGCYLEKLFIDTDRMGRGYGKTLYQWALNAALRLGATEMIIEADPDAAAFYEKMGGVAAGVAPSGSVAGRTLPRFIHSL